jgi:hypothetical protein
MQSYAGRSGNKPQNYNFSSQFSVYQICYKISRKVIHGQKKSVTFFACSLSPTAIPHHWKFDLHVLSY